MEKKVFLKQWQHQNYKMGHQYSEKEALPFAIHILFASRFVYCLCLCSVVTSCNDVTRCECARTYFSSISGTLLFSIDIFKTKNTILLPKSGIFVYQLIQIPTSSKVDPPVT